jgi:hypothetical protein
MRKDGWVCSKPQVASHRPRDLRRFEGMREPGPVVIGLVVHEHLGLVLEPPERGAVNDPVAVPLERRAEPVLRLGVAPPARARARAGVRSEKAPLPFFEKAPIGHRTNPRFEATPCAREMSKRAWQKEKRAETSFEVRPLFRAYDRRELGLPNRALSRLESIRLVDASTESKSCAMAIEPRPID